MQEFWILTMCYTVTKEFIWNVSSTVFWATELVCLAWIWHHDTGTLMKFYALWKSEGETCISFLLTNWLSPLAVVSLGCTCWWNYYFFRVPLSFHYLVVAGVDIYMQGNNWSCYSCKKTSVLCCISVYSGS
jgi:hypothetical protein